jgi:BirA family biotin operon repressor/biotin-[acetyl-CoA-carboxylase] ligase
MAALPAGFRHEHLDQVGSTNAVALERAEAGDPGGLWITAGEQAAGRGRGGRAWISPPGNLYATLLLVDPCPARDAAQLGFVAGVALIDAIDAMAGDAVRAALKWPNDVLVGDAKVAGILPEARHGGRLAVAIGLGVNCRSRPLDTPYPAIDLSRAAGRTIEPAALFAHLAAAMAQALDRFDRARGFAAILDAWRARAAGLGGPILVRPPDGPVEGVFEGLDPDGALRLRQGGTVRRIAAGDVYFPRAAGLHGPDRDARKEGWA